MMKKMFVVLILLGVLACTPLYDTLEYEKYITIATLMDEKKCTKENVDRLVDESRYLFRYSFHKPNDQEVVEATFEIYSALKELQTRLELGKLSPKYCELKFSGISMLVARYAEIVGKRPR